MKLQTIPLLLRIDKFLKIGKEIL
ncbi:hypothetical protein B4U79_00538 [Dinothrombium tinctorium]|uniref:Uncharacterized protein n=1 Tax=Dinothrombium tinctorium TaxID=1965070 RepID=A0A3S3P881_9ACAR|nr:hypothetical protein B4U79_06132 [Dinothrombium tinctorium]RWS14289.1 hypothetical protein B4U79_00538 [Dinothrombium tinctorium]